MGRFPLQNWEVSFDQWVFEVRGVQKSSGKVILWEAITHSLRGTAADLVQCMGSEASVTDILDKLMTIYGMVASFDCSDSMGCNRRKGSMLPHSLQG